MLYTITAVSPEVEDFAIELQIESDATFADLHRLIRRTCEWGEHKPSIFYICDERWHRDHTIPERSYEDDTMDEVELGDFLDDEGQRLQYIFDADENRGLLMEITHIAYGKHIDVPLCKRRHGLAPALEIDKSEEVPYLIKSNGSTGILPPVSAVDDDDIEPTDDELFDIEEIDLEGFDFTEG